MSRLIKNELIKIFKKKSIYITLLIVLSFIILTNCIYKFFYHSGSYDEYSDNYIEYAKEEIKKLDPNKPSDTKMYIDIKSTLDMYELAQKYEANSWQRSLLSVQLAKFINEKNTYLYGENKEPQKVKEMEQTITEILGKLEEGDWKYFANKDLEQAKTELASLEEQKTKTRR